MPTQLPTCPNDDSLLAFMLGNVSDPQAGLIAEHLDGCTVCDQTATRMERSSDPFVAELRRPTGDASVFSDAKFREAVDRIAALGRAPDSLGINPLEVARQRKEFGQYVLLEKIGQGGMGAVYKAMHARLEKVVAVKVLPPESTRDAAAVARFDREMKAVGRLEHPHLVRAMDAGEVDDMHYLVMEYVEGMDLSRLVKSAGPLRVADACEIVRQAALGLAHAHRQGLVHRDIKPSNLMLAWTPSSSEEPQAFEREDESHTTAQVKILDMGLALLADAQQAEITGSGQMMGTLDYMAPEQGGDSHDVDARADVYSLGATLYRLLVGEPIYHGPQYQTQIQKMMALANAPPPPIQSRRADIPDEVAAVVHRMIVRDPAERYGTAVEVSHALAPWTHDASLARLLQERSGADVAERFSESSLRTAPERSTASLMPESATEHKPRTKSDGPRYRLTLTVGALLLALILLAASVFTFRTPEGTITVEIDKKYEDDVALKINGDDKSLLLSAGSGWQMKLKPGQYEVDLGESSDLFSVDQGTVNVRRGNDTVVRVIFKPRVDAVTKEEMRKLGEEAVAWVAEHNALAEEEGVVADARLQITEETQRRKGFVYSMAGSLLKSDKPTCIALVGNKLHVNELSNKEAELMGLAEQPIATCTKGFPTVGTRMARPEFELVSVAWDEDEMAATKDVAGWTSFRRLHDSDEQKVRYWLRVTVAVHQPVSFYQGISGDLAADKGQIRIRFDNPASTNSPTARMAFVEVGRFDGPDDDFENFVALSDPISAVVMLPPKP